MTLDDAIRHTEEVVEGQISNAHTYESMMVFKQSIEHNTEAKFFEEEMNECIKCANEYRQISKWLKELRAYRKMYHKEHEDDCLIAENEDKESDTEKRKECINYEDGCEEWAGCPCVYYKAESEGKE